MKRVKMNKDQLQELLNYYECRATDVTQVKGEAITYQSKSGKLIAVVFYDYKGVVKQVFIPNYVERNCPTIANIPCAATRVNGHGTG